MKVADLTRNGPAVLSALKSEGKAVYTLKPMTVYAPVAYVEKGMGEIGAHTQLMGFLGLVIGNEYAVMNVNTVFYSEPDSTSIETIEDTDYYVFTYEPGSKFIVNRNAVKVDTLVYYIFNMFIGWAKIPWFASIPDLAKLFVTAKTYAGANILQSNVVFEMILAQLVRTPSNKAKFFRAIANDLANAPRDTWSIVPLRSGLYGATNTTSALIGAYYDDSQMTAINNPSTKVTPIEKLLNT